MIMKIQQKQHKIKRNNKIELELEITFYKLCLRLDGGNEWISTSILSTIK